jgi:hypothetical protein
VYDFAKPLFTGEPVKSIRVCLFVIVALLCLPMGMAQPNAKPGYDQAHKNAEKYQKHLMKQRRKQEKAQAKKGRAYLKQHGHDTNPSHP